MNPAPALPATTRRRLVVEDGKRNISCTVFWASGLPFARRLEILKSSASKTLDELWKQQRGFSLSKVKMSDPVELLPCPFCAGPAKLEQVDLRWGLSIAREAFAGAARRFAARQYGR
jgi:hypothetical protein